MRARRSRARLSMTSLIDVIFLLLLFFMLSSTFSQFADLPLSTASTAGARELRRDTPPILLRLSPDGATVNGRDVRLDDLLTSSRALAGNALPETPFIVSLTPGTKAELLVQVMHRLRQVPKAQITVVH